MIDEQLRDHIISLLTGWLVTFDYFYDDQGEDEKQFIIRSAGGGIDGFNGEPSFDLVAIGVNQDSGAPKTVLSQVTDYLLTNFAFADIINVNIVSGARPSGMLSNNRPVYTMTISLITERKEGL